MGSHINYVMTLANSIIGVGILAMPFCFQKCGIILAIIMVLLSSIISRLSCHFLLKASIYSRRKNFEFLAFHALGSTGKLSVELGIIGFLMGTVIAFFVVVGDLGPEIIAKAFNIESSQSLRSWILILITIGCVIPLGLLRNVDSLTSICTITIGFYMCLVIKVMLESTKHISNSDWIDKVELWQPSGILQCLPIFSMALFCQTQIFEIYSRMENASLEKMNLVIKWAINICAMVYILVGSFGYIAFCHQHFGGNILLSFSPTPLSDIIKMGFVLSVAFSFPLAIFPCRASLYSLLFRRVTSQHEVIPIVMPERRFRCLTILIVAVGLIIAMVLPSIELVLGLVGSTMGVAVCVLLPAACYVKIVTKNNNERLLAQIVLVIGILIMIFGTYANLYAMDEAKSTVNVKGLLVEDDVILVPLDDSKIKLLIKDSKNKKTNIDNIDNNNQETIPKQKDLPKAEIIDSPPLPVEKEELANIVKTQELDNSVKKNVVLTKNENIVHLIDIENNLKNLNKQQLVKDLKNIKVPEEISDDAIKKEENELNLENNNNEETLKTLKGKQLQSDLKLKVEEEKKISLIKNQNSLKLETITEGIAIEKIIKEKQQLDDEFERKLLQNSNLLTKNIRKFPNIEIETKKEKDESNNKINKNKISIEISEKSKKDKQEIKEQSFENRLDVHMKENDVQKNSKILVNNFESISKAVSIASHIKQNEKELSNIQNEKPVTTSNIEDNNKIKTISKLLIPLIKNETKQNDDNADKFIHRGMLQLDTIDKDHTNRFKRNLDHENTQDENCPKHDKNSLTDTNINTLSRVKMLNPDEVLKTHALLDVLKPSIRELKSIEAKDDHIHK